MYLSDVSELEILDVATERELIRKYQEEGCVESRDRVVKGAMRYAVHRVRQKCGGAAGGKGGSHAFTRDEELEAIADATLALFNAIDSFNPERAGDSKFILYARWHIDESIRRTFSVRHAVAGTPRENKMIYSASRRIRAMADELTGDIEHDVALIVDKTKISRRVATMLLRQGVGRDSGHVFPRADLENCTSTDGEYTQTRSIGDAVVQAGQPLAAAEMFESLILRTPDTANMDAERHNVLASLIAMLPPQRALVLRLYYGVDSPQFAVPEIADLLDKTHQRITQLLTAALSELRNNCVSMRLDLRSLH